MNLKERQLSFAQVVNRVKQQTALKGKTAATMYGSKYKQLKNHGIQPASKQPESYAKKQVRK